MTTTDPKKEAEPTPKLQTLCRLTSNVRQTMGNAPLPEGWMRSQGASGNGNWIWNSVFQHHTLVSKRAVNRSIVSSQDSTMSEITGYKLDDRGLIPPQGTRIFLQIPGAHLKGPDG
jgi:hypothetical protein